MAPWLPLGRLAVRCALRNAAVLAPRSSKQLALPLALAPHRPGCMFPLGLPPVLSPHTVVVPPPLDSAASHPPRGGRLSGGEPKNLLVLQKFLPRGAEQHEICLTALERVAEGAALLRGKNFCSSGQSDDDDDDCIRA